MSEYAMNPFDHLAPHDGPYPTVAMPHPFNRQPVFSTMGRGPRGEKGNGIISINSSEFPPNDQYAYGTLLSITDTGDLYMFIESNEWKQI